VRNWAFVRTAERAELDSLVGGIYQWRGFGSKCSTNQRVIDGSEHGDCPVGME
jgi:hypothetical protein